MENGLLYVLAFSAMAIALFAAILPQLPVATSTVVDVTGTADASVPINAALESSNWVDVVGVGTCRTKIILYSHNKLTIYGTLTAADQLNSSMIVNNASLTTTNAYVSPTGTYDHDITIQGGTIDGNKANQVNATDYKCTIHMIGVNGLTINGVHLVNGWTEAIRTAYCTDVLISDNLIEYSADDGIAVNMLTYNAAVTENIVKYAGFGGGSYGAPFGIEVEDGSRYVTVSNNAIVNCSDGGIGVNSHAGYLPCYGVTLTGNVLNYSNIEVYGLNSSALVNSVSIAGNVVDSTLGSDAGIYLINTGSGSITGNTIYSAATDGVHSAGSYTSIMGNTIVGNIRHGIYVYASTATQAATLVIGNVAKSNALMGIKIDANVANATVQNNLCVDNGNAAGGSQVGVGVSGDFTVVSGNTCYDSRSGASRKQQYGIVVYAGAVGTLVIDNSLNNHSSSDYFDAGTGTVYHDNYVNGAWVT